MRDSAHPAARRATPRARFDRVDVKLALDAALLYVISGDGEPGAQADSLCAAVDGGADVVQLRNKIADKGRLLEAARRVAAHARAHGALFIVNDHVDLAIAASADGVHLGQEDLPPAAARAIWPGSHLVGRSTHSLEQALAAVREGVDYIGVGPVFATPTKAGRPAVGLGLLGRVRDSVDLPWFAIGGIDAGSLGEVLAAGAHRVAVVRAVCSAADPSRAAAQLRARLDAVPVQR